MAKTKRTVLALVLTCLMVCLACFTLTACGGSYESINVTKPTKTDYIKGETLDLTGMEVNGLKKDKWTPLKADEYTVTPAGGSTLTEDTVVTVALAKNSEISKTFKVTVHNKVKDLTIKTAPTKTEYWGGRTSIRQDLC